MQRVSFDVILSFRIQVTFSDGYEYKYVTNDRGQYNFQQTPEIVHGEAPYKKISLKKDNTSN